MKQWLYSQNPRIDWEEAGKDLQGHWVQPVTDPPQGTECHLQGWGLHRFPGQRLPILLILLIIGNANSW